MIHYAPNILIFGSLFVMVGGLLWNNLEDVRLTFRPNRFKRCGNGYVDTLTGEIITKHGADIEKMTDEDYTHAKRLAEEAEILRAHVEGNTIERKEFDGVYTLTTPRAKHKKEAQSYIDWVKEFKENNA